MNYENHYNEIADMSDGYNTEPNYGYDNQPNYSYHDSGNDSSSIGGWVIWIGLLLFINFLSWIFDWSFWVY